VLYITLGFITEFKELSRLCTIDPHFSRSWRSQPTRWRLCERKALTGCSQAEDRRARAQRRPTMRHFETTQGISWLCIQDTVEVSVVLFPYLLQSQSLAENLIARVRARWAKSLIKCD